MRNSEETYVRAMDRAAAAACDGSEPRHVFSRQWSDLPPAEKKAWVREFWRFLDDVCEEELMAAEKRRHPAAERR